jgi:hypothetical protein
MGRTEMQRKDYPGALRDLGKITFGPNKDEAQELIQQARIGISGGIVIDPASLAAFKGAREAYFRGDFDVAESQAKRVQSAALQAAANQLLANVSVYRDVMKQADAMAHNGDLKGAEQKYQFAVTILQNGPSHPQDRLREVQTAEAQAATTKPQPQSQPATTVQTAQSKAARPPSKVNNAAKSKNSLDTARREETQGDQAEVVAGKKRVLEEMQEDPKVIEDSLTEGVADFYASHFSHADHAIRVYLDGGGKHYAGSAHFYLGASLLMQALLTSPKDQSEADALRQQARGQFVLAKQLHYKPIESTVSPKVLTQWTQTGEQQ